MFEGEVEMVSTKTGVGSIGVLANHAPVMAILEPAELKLYKSGSENPDSGDAEVFAQGEGYLQVIDNSALLVVEEAIRPAELDRSNIETKLGEARERLERAQKEAPEGGWTPEVPRRARAPRGERGAAASGGRGQALRDVPGDRRFGLARAGILPAP